MLSSFFGGHRSHASLVNQKAGGMRENTKALSPTDKSDNIDAPASKYPGTIAGSIFLAEATLPLLEAPSSCTGAVLVGVLMSS